MPTNLKLLALFLATFFVLISGAKSPQAAKAAGAVCDCEANDSSADCCGDCRPGTLFQWSYGNSFSGGPDLDEPLVTDRPDFTESSVTVGQGVTQVEMGYTYFDDSEAGTTTRSHSYPEILLRQGILAEWLELRVGWNYGNEEITQGVAVTNNDGSEDLYLGFKIALTPQECWLPEMALIPQWTVPTGADAFSADRVLAGVNWTYSWEVTESWSIAGSTQGNSNVDDVTADAYWEMAQSVASGYSITEQIGAYVEWYAFFPHSADTALPEHFFNGGFSYLVNNNIQFDWRAGLGLNNAADDFFTGVGISIRRP